MLSIKIEPGEIDENEATEKDEVRCILPHLGSTCSDDLLTGVTQEFPVKPKDTLKTSSENASSDNLSPTPGRSHWKKKVKKNLRKKAIQIEIDGYEETSNNDRQQDSVEVEMIKSLETQLPPITKQGRGTDINPSLNGMHTFGLDKTGITRAVVRFQKPPGRNPCTMCFHFPGKFLTHRYVLEMVRCRITYATGTAITAIRFVDRNAILGTQGLDNRWLVTVNDARARDELLKVGLLVYNRRIALRKYDSILQEEYQEFLQYQALQARLYIKVDTCENREDGQAQLTEDEIKTNFSVDDDDDDDD